jgi:SsrA-binding protein
MRRRVDIGGPLRYSPAMADKEKPKIKLIAENRRARHDYFIESDLEAGVVLEGSEVKALRNGKAQITESYASVEGGELWLVNGYIPAYAQAKTFGHDERRRRKLLVHRAQLAKLAQGIGREGMTIVPLRLYFNERGVAKVQLGIARGKKMADKRETAKKRDWQREKARLLKAHG